MIKNFISGVVVVAAVFGLSGSATGNPIDNLQPGEWYEAPSSQLSAVDPCPARNCSYSAVEGVSAVMNDWSGGAYDTKRDRLIVWGGGHGGYAGNEVYAFEIDTLQWQRLTEPSTQVSVNTFYYSDGLPTSRHTYDFVEYLPIIDSFCSAGVAGRYGSGGSGSAFDCLNLGTLQWEQHPNVPNRVWGIGAIGGVDGSGNLWSHGTQSGPRLAKYNPLTKTWATFPINNNVWFDYYYTAEIDTTRNKMYAVGKGQTLVWDLNNPTAGLQVLTTSGDTEIQFSNNPGLAFHPSTGNLVAWNGGADVYIFDPDTNIWTRTVPAATSSVIPTGRNRNGTFGRFRYIPSKDVFIVVNSVNQNVYFYKLQVAQ